MGRWVSRAIFTIFFTAITYFLRPFDLTPIVSLAIGLGTSCIVVLIEIKIQRDALRTIIGAAAGSIVGILAAVMTSFVVTNITVMSPRTQSFIQLSILAIMLYLGLFVGISKADLISLDSRGLLKGNNHKGPDMILDTSVIIDGRIADILKTGFLEGQFILPEFVLWELQTIADSSNPLRKSRGRCGLDILEKIQKQSRVPVKITDQDYPDIAGVDIKLIELAKETGAKIVTNDFNLNKVAQLRGVKVLNINELANTLKPIVLPGETIKVFILKEGKEGNQGVAYLDDGTMVVVDNARKMIGRTANVMVTSLLQTTTGKMIFGKYLQTQTKGGHEKGQRKQH